MTVEVKVRLTPEEKNAVPDWEEQVAIFQRRCDHRTKDKRERFRVCLHEGGHTVQYRNQFRWDVKFLGPYVSYKDGELHFAKGAVRAISNGYDPLPWQHAMVSTSSFLLVEHFTAVPNDQFTIQNDLQGLRRDLGPDADLNDAVWNAEIMLEGQLSEPNFIGELKQACRDYEIDVYATDEATEWGWKEYRPDFKGTRHRVGVTTTGYFGTLVVEGDDLTLLTQGGAYKPIDTIRRNPLIVMIAEPERVGGSRVVEKWNRAVSCEVITA